MGIGSVLSLVGLCEVQFLLPHAGTSAMLAVRCGCLKPEGYPDPYDLSPLGVDT